jgi:hypothetical protein
MRHSASDALRGTPETVAIKHEGVERVIRALVVGLPPAALAVGGWLAWGGALHWQDLVMLGIMYTLIGLGITVGYHRASTSRVASGSTATSAKRGISGTVALCRRDRRETAAGPEPPSVTSLHSSRNVGAAATAARPWHGLEHLSGGRAEGGERRPRPRSSRPARGATQPIASAAVPRSATPGILATGWP